MLSTNILMEENIMSMKILLDQYKKELEELEQGIGLARKMTKLQINTVKFDLEDRINNLEEELKGYI